MAVVIHSVAYLALNLKSAIRSSLQFILEMFISKLLELTTRGGKIFTLVQEMAGS